MNKLFREFVLAEQVEKSLVGDMMLLTIPFAVADVKSESGKTYPAELLKRACATFNQFITGRTAYGAATHVEGALELPDVSHLVEHTFVKDGKAFARLRLLPTKIGNNLIQILKGGGAVGASMRAVGRYDGEGRVLEMSLTGVDITLAPSWQGLAESSACFESLDVGAHPDDAKLRERYRLALTAGFSGSFESYRRVAHGK